MKTWTVKSYDIGWVAYNGESQVYLDAFGMVTMVPYRFTTEDEALSAVKWWCNQQGLNVTEADGPSGPSEAKDTNPKDSLGIRKCPMHAVSCVVLMEMGLGMMDGACKYGTHNYRKMGVRASVYYDAAMRHLMSWWEGEDVDPDSGLNHITKVLTCLSVLRDSQIMGNWKDDRPLQLPDQLNTKRLNKIASDIVDKYPDPKKPFTQKED